MKRAVRAIIRLIAAGLMVWGGMEIGLEWMRHHLQKGDTSPWHWVLGVILLVLGGFLFLASASLAEQLTDDPDE